MQYAVDTGADLALSGALKTDSPGVLGSQFRAADSLSGQLLGSIGARFSEQMDSHPHIFGVNL